MTPEIGSEKHLLTGLSKRACKLLIFRYIFKGEFVAILALKIVNVGGNLLI